MALTFTLGASLVVKEGPDATREIVIGILGCSITWGIIDGLLYVFNSMYRRGAINRFIHAYNKNGRQAVDGAIAEYIQGTFGSAVTGTTAAAMRRDVTEFITGARTVRVRLTRNDVYGAIASFILVVFTAAPAVLPFSLLKDHLIALRVSNFIMIALIYWIGTRWAAHIDASPQRVGISMAVGSLIIVELAILLGG